MHSVYIKMVDEELMKFSRTEELLIYIDREDNLFTIETKRGDVFFFCDLDQVEYAYQGILETKDAVMKL